MGINRVDKGSVGTFSVTSLLIFFFFRFFLFIIQDEVDLPHWITTFNSLDSTRKSGRKRYDDNEDAEENKKIIVIEKQSKAADQKSAKEEALTAKTGGLEQLIVKAQSTWRAKAA